MWPGHVDVDLFLLPRLRMSGVIHLWLVRGLLWSLQLGAWRYFHDVWATVVVRLDPSLRAVPIVRTTLDEKWCHPAVWHGKKAERTAAVLSGTAAVLSAPTCTTVPLFLRRISYRRVRASGIQGEDG